ncbi:MAG: hypothetical protein EOP13_25170 [Pseudomonas sp.]|uniref:hypothetical protein n=1 Tax=Pseudomonas sp. TaxID=306 RepID=UPI0012066E41|nr:hypothetical protein [Pseudomonas sp.]RZI68409.1 MAG: hypothetical protein EOP13_25170 [Pseudomonas sp.]
MLHQLDMRVNAEAIVEEFNLADFFAAKSEVSAEKWHVYIRQNAAGRKLRCFERLRRAGAGV